MYADSAFGEHKHTEKNISSEGECGCGKRRIIERGTHQTKFDLLENFKRKESRAQRMNKTNRGNGIQRKKNRSRKHSLQFSLSRRMDDKTIDTSKWPNGNSNQQTGRPGKKHVRSTHILHLVLCNEGCCLQLQIEHPTGHPSVWTHVQRRLLFTIAIEHPTDHPSAWTHNSVSLRRTRLSFVLLSHPCAFIFRAPPLPRSPPNVYNMYSRTYHVCMDMQT